MRIQITGRHVGVTEAMKDYAREKVEKLEKYYGRATKVEVTMDSDHAKSIVEIVASVNRHVHLVGKAESPDMYAAVDLAEVKLARQLQKHKQKLTDHHRGEDVMGSLAGRGERPGPRRPDRPEGGHLRGSDRATGGRGVGAEAVDAAACSRRGDHAARSLRAARSVRPGFGRQSARFSRQSGPLALRWSAPLSPALSAGPASKENSHDTSHGRRQGHPPPPALPRRRRPRGGDEGRGRARPRRLLRGLRVRSPAHARTSWPPRSCSARCEGTTGIGAGVAVPHAKTALVKELLVAVGLSRTGIDFSAVDGDPVHVIFLIAAPPEATAEYLALMKWVVSLTRSKYWMKLIRACKTPEALVSVLEETA